MDFLNLVVSLASGAAGGNAAGAAMKNASLGPLGNTISGALGGGAVSLLAPVLLGMATGQGFDAGALVSSVVGGGAGGAVLTMIIGLIKNAAAAKS